MKRTLVGGTIVLATLAAIAMPAQAQRRTMVGVAAGATFPGGRSW